MERLVDGLRQTIEGSAADSPIFRLVPKLEPQDWTRLVVVPADFREEVEKAVHDRHRGDLELLSLEAQAFDWAPEGLRLVGSRPVRPQGLGGCTGHVGGDAGSTSRAITRSTSGSAPSINASAISPHRTSR